MRNIIAIVLFVASAVIGLDAIKQAQGPKPDWPCIWPFCESVTTQEAIALNARNQALVSADINRGHHVPIAFAPVE